MLRQLPKYDVLLKYKPHNKNVKIRERKGEQQQQKITARRRSYIWFYYELRVGTPRIYSYHTLLLGIHPKKNRIREFKKKSHLKAAINQIDITNRYFSFPQ